MDRNEFRVSVDEMRIIELHNDHNAMIIMEADPRSCDINYSGSLLGTGEVWNVSIIIDA